MCIIRNIITFIILSLFSTLRAEVPDLKIQLNSIADTKKQIEYCLALDTRKDGIVDSNYLKEYLRPLLQHKNKGLQVAYYLLLADAASIIFDQVNPVTDAYFNQAMGIAEQSGVQEYRLLPLIRRGYYYFTYREISAALPYFLSASNLVQEANLDQVAMAARHLQWMANFYGYIGNSTKALEYYKKAVNYAPKDTRQTIDILNAIGVYYYRDSIYDKAHHYYKEGLKVAERTKDTVWMGILQGNIGNILLAKGDTSQAIVLSEMNVKTSLKYEDFSDAMRTLLGLAEIAVAQKRWNQAKAYLAQAEVYFEPKPFFLMYKTAAYELKAKIAQAEGNKTEAIYYLNQFITYNDSTQQQKDSERLQQATWNWEAERFNLAITEAENKRKQDRFRDLSISIVLILTLLSITLLIHRSRQRIRIKTIKLEKDQLALLLEKELLDNQLIQAKTEMEDFLLRIKENEKIIQDLGRKLANAQVNHQNDHVDEIQESLNQMLDSHMMTDERWYRFKSLFDTTHPGFFEEITVRYPNISENNLRLLTLSKLNLNNQSIAHLLGISLDGVKKAKQRLRKKISQTAADH
ncbi:tetratricopeptide repeat protein [Sphingobacterium paucimobilis]|uniref:Uncharacterized protein n=1 Tax=Sphingobacterium paucimobilis HER1398 TaxID=1346330 RepID=U2J5Z6_9SPHI|nr:tetratricopeptide repeat protein [Sphingobacterium paucimobilis]ERJ58053.1 hypothetical protein M472_04675 [Sphingobacterium paucimobilis HER1398]